VTKTAMERPEVKEFVKFYLTKAKEIVPQVGYVALPDEVYSKGLSSIK